MPKVTERNMLDLLHRRYTVATQGSGSRYVTAEHVRNGLGFGGWDEQAGKSHGLLRTADFMAVDTWESTGAEIIGHEVKVSRSDWLHELADPTKAEAMKQFCHRWFLVTSDPAIVRPGELPAGWGLITIAGNTLRATTRAPRLTPAPMPHSVTVALMRAVAKTATREANR